jgi:cytochrome c biogenesis protein
MVAEFFRDLFIFFSSRWVVAVLLVLTLGGVLFSLANPQTLPPVLFFAGIWYTRFLWLLLGVSLLTLLLKGIAGFSKRAVERTIPFALWQFLTSIPMAITLIGLLVLIGLVSTVVPQFTFNREIDLLSRFGTASYNLMNSLGLFTIFSTPYTYAIVGLFVINLLACTYKRLDATLRYVRMPMKPKHPDALSLMPNYSELPITTGTSQSILEGIQKRLQKKGFRVWQEGGQLLAEKLRRERFSIDIFHISLLVAIGALLVTNVFGYDYVQVNYKDSTFKVRNRAYDVHVDDFWSNNYPGTERVMDWKTTLTVSENGSTLRTCTIEVNHPCTVQGVSMYQAAMGEDWLSGANVNFVVLKTDATQSSGYKFVGEYNAHINKSFAILDEKVEVKFGAFLPDFTLLNGTAYSKTQRLLNPAAYLEVYPLNADAESKPLFITWTLKNAPMVQFQLDTPYKFIINGMTAESFTGLEFSWDPGMPIAYVGFAMIILMLLGHLFFNHQMLWIQVNSETGVIQIGGRCRKGDFTDKFDRIVNGIGDQLGSSPKAIISDGERVIPFGKQEEAA